MVLCALAEVLFDIDKGHSVAALHPPGLFTDAEINDIAFSSFPDSLSMELRASSSVRDSSFCFRLRRRSPPPGAPQTLSFIYGHAFCRQRQDEALRRGAEQKSVVLLSWLPLYSVLEPLARLVGPTVLSYGPDALRQVFEEVQQWPPLDWGCRMELPLLGVESLSVQLPLLASLPSSALPAAVAAGMGQYAVAAALSSLPGSLEQAPGEGGGGAAAAAAGEGGREGGAGGEDAAAAGEEGAAAAGGEGASAGVQAGHLLAASPAQVAMALADELDGNGIPLGMLPQAYGQVEPEASVFGDVDCFTPLRPVLQQLWALWELLLLGEPLMVVSPTPGGCSAAVAALLSLLAPFPYSLDWRPYYTIHDSSFARLAAGEAPTASNGLPMLLGITNMYFLKALPDWPNVLSTGHTAASVLPSSSSDRLDQMAGGSSGGAASNGSAGGGMHGSESASSAGSSSSSLAGSGGGGLGGLRPGLGGVPSPGGSTSRLGGMLRRRPATPAALLSGPLDQCWLGYKPLSRPDKTVLDRLVQPQPADPSDKWRRLAAVNSALLRRHFQELTRALLAPLMPYIQPALPPPPSGQQGGADPRAAPMVPPPLPRLDVPTLLARLSSKDARLPDILTQRFGGHRGVMHFYERLLRSPNFVAFMHLRRLAAAEWQRQEWEAAAAAAAAPMEELLSVEAFFHLEQRLVSARQQLATASSGGAAIDGTGDVGAAVGSPSGGGGLPGGQASDADAQAEAALLAEQLQQELQLAFSDLPEDLQAVIMQTPSHAALLGQRPGHHQPGQQQQHLEQ